MADSEFLKNSLRDVVAIKGDCGADGLQVHLGRGRE
jgi:hypothetical protein